jgi:hypothetical protein
MIQPPFVVGSAMQYAIIKSKHGRYPAMFRFRLGMQSITMMMMVLTAATVY